MLAPYAMASGDSRGRRHPEPEHEYRGPFQRDRDRIIHSAAYRRLSGKMQVFTGEMGDYHRTRLTHTLEVSGLARTLARALALNEDLVEALALLHDLGHPPFGHTGEEVLDDCLAEHGGFDHNAQTLQIVEWLERRWLPKPGLNLTFEVLEGQTTRVHKSASDTRPLLEAQVVEAADSVAYDTHDADDALVLGLLSLPELLEVPLWRQAAGRVRRRFCNLADEELRRACVHELIDWQISELLRTADARLADWQVDSTTRVRECPVVVGFEEEFAQQKAELERFLFDRVYRHPLIVTIRGRVAAEISELFALLLAQPQQIAPEFFPADEPSNIARAAGNLIASQTDQGVARLLQALT